MEMFTQCFRKANAWQRDMMSLPDLQDAKFSDLCSSSWEFRLEKHNTVLSCCCPLGTQYEVAQVLDDKIAVLAHFARQQDAVAFVLQTLAKYATSVRSATTATSSTSSTTARLAS